MLPPNARLRRARDFTDTVRGGRRAGSELFVLYLAQPAGARSATGGPAQRIPQVGVVASRAVGNAVTRNRVKRRLRHLAAERLDQLCPGYRLVVRALPPASTASSAQLARALDTALSRLGQSAPATRPIAAARPGSGRAQPC